MTRTTSPRKIKRRKLLMATKGYKRPANNHFKIANQRFLKAQVNAFRDRRNKKRVFRHLWISRLNALVRNVFAISYSNFIYKLKKTSMLYDRKLMAQLAIYDWFFFKYLMLAMN